VDRYDSQTVILVNWQCKGPNKHNTDIIIISSNVTCSHHEIAVKIAHLALNKNQSLTY